MEALLHPGLQGDGKGGGLTGRVAAGLGYDRVMACARLPDHKLAIGVLVEAEDANGDLVEGDRSVGSLGEAAGAVVEGPDFLAVGGGELAVVIVGFPGAVEEAVLEGEVPEVGEGDAGDAEVDLTVGVWRTGNVPDFTSGLPGMEKDALAGVSGLIVDEKFHQYLLN